MSALKRLTMISLSLTLLMMGISSSAFTTINTPSIAAASNKRPITRVSRTKLYFISDFSAVESFHSSLLNLHASIAPTTGFSTPKLSAEVEAEVLNDMCHVVMDFSGFFGLSKPELQLCSVFGRILIIGAECLPDQNVHPEELVIQLVLLAINLNDVVKVVSLHQQPSDRN